VILYGIGRVMLLFVHDGLGTALTVGGLGLAELIFCFQASSESKRRYE
jgi:hypothetical protein